MQRLIDRMEGRVPLNDRMEVVEENDFDRFGFA